MRIGAHVSAAGGVDKAVDRAQEMGAECLQLFAGGGPQSWRFTHPGPAACQAFRQKSQQTGIAPNFMHGIYLINLGTPDPSLVAKSVEALVQGMDLAADLGIAGVIFHLGSHKGAGQDAVFQQVVQAIQQVLARAKPGPWLVMENSAGMGQHIGSSFAELGRILRAVDSPRLKICLDTQHCWAAGYNVASREGLEKTLDEFDRAIGLRHLVAVHANDSKVPLGSGVDRHENIGDGLIGAQGFVTILSHPALRDVPFYLEVPGPDGKGPDRTQVERLKALRAQAGVPA
ncbi:MAG: deoxyribonuclease IV [Dehalococcoidia bacterium]|nr:deoxyribonuclease IV [Dehalococcoidia bacterium]MDW8119196.1 deoxyribonuclease IV [Chloroflexota bacterium]